MVIRWCRRAKGRRHAPPNLPEPEVVGGSAPASQPVADPGAAASEPWGPMARQFALRVLSLAYQAGSHLAEVETAEQDPDQLQRLYRVDHALTRIRRAAENLQVLAGVRIDDPGRQVTTLVDVVRAAASAIADYQRVHVGHAVELAVTEVAADDVIRILTELVDNAVRFSAPSTPVTVSAHLTDAGHVMLRVEDAGIGIDAARLPRLNAMLDGAVGIVLDDQQATHLGLPVAACLARAHRSLRVQLSPRRPIGTTAMLLVGSDLVCEIPRGAAPAGATAAPPLPDGAWPRQPAPPAAGPLQPTDAATTAVLPVQPAATAPMPRRVPASVRGSGRPAGLPSAPSAHLRPWEDDAADFAAGVEDAQRPS